MTTTARRLGWTPLARPVRIAALLELYERNFRLVQRLAPELDLPFDEAVSTSRGDPPLRMTVLERGRWTAAFRLTYVFGEGADATLEPDLRVRIYRDAQLAEALTRPQRPPWLADEAGESAAMRFLDEQWSRNLLLHKWLQYLLDQGHGFSMAARPRLATAAAC